MPISPRTSDYIIYVKLPETGEFLLVHGYTGAIDLVQPNVVEFLKHSQEKLYVYAESL